MNNKMTISQFARAGGVGIETVRFYHRRGLLPIPQAMKGFYRHYDQTLLQQLRFIRRAQLGGFTLKEIQELLKCDSQKHRQNIQEIARKRLTQLAAHINQLQDIHDVLAQLLQQCEEQDSQAPCPIIQALAGIGSATEV
jgi:MerR family transcriptional regulator, mercuric resistance operon regulatory protein